jgi:general stress protein 26
VSHGSRGRQIKMTINPVTELDPRFSDPNAAATTWATTERVLEGAQLFWVTTVRADGRPHVTPLVAVWLDGALHFATGPDEQKGVNLRTNPHVILSTGCNDWDHGVDVVLEGDAERVTDTDRLRRLAQSWAKKWDGQWQYEIGDAGFRHDAGDALVFRVEPTKVLAFAKGTFAHTRYRF